MYPRCTCYNSSSWSDFFVVFPRYYFFSVLRYRHGSNGYLRVTLFVTLCFASKEKTPSADARKSIGGMSLPATDDDCFRIAAVRPRATTSRRRLSAVSAPSGEGNMRKEVLHCWPPPLVFPKLFSFNDDPPVFSGCFSLQGHGFI